MRKTYILFILAAMLSACELIGNIDDITPDFKLTDQNEIEDAKSAEASINGVYISWRSEMLIGWMRHYLNALTGSGNEVRVIGMEGFKQNSVELSCPEIGLHNK